MALSKTTQDHEEIQKWAEARGAKPAEVSSTHTTGSAGILRFEFPHAPHHNDGALQEISWEDFFQKFDESNLELLYQDVTAEGAQSNFNKLIHPTEEEHSSYSAAARKSAKKSAKKAVKTAVKKAPAKKIAAKKIAAKNTAAKPTGKSTSVKTAAKTAATTAAKTAAKKKAKSK